MMISDREGFMAWVHQLRGSGAARRRAPANAEEPPADRLLALEARVAYLEQLLEGLQDSVHRESDRHGKLIAELEARIRPGPMGAALARDARDRGL
jgi:hypothetical protein